MEYYTEPVAIERIVKEYSKQCFIHKFENLEEIGHFLKNQLPKLSLDEIDCLNNAVNH